MEEYHAKTTMTREELEEQARDLIADEERHRELEREKTDKRRSTEKRNNGGF
jgi:hypothetical protein